MMTRTCLFVCGFYFISAIFLSSITNAMDQAEMRRQKTATSMVNLACGWTPDRPQVFRDKYIQDKECNNKAQRYYDCFKAGLDASDPQGDLWGIAHDGVVNPGRARFVTFTRNRFFECSVSINNGTIGEANF